MPATLLASHNLRSFSVGTCYARTETYPTGVYLGGAVAGAELPYYFMGTL